MSSKVPPRMNYWRQSGPRTGDEAIFHLPLLLVLLSFLEEDLTAREIEVLRLIRDGNRNKQIADRLSIAETTVNFHIKNLVGKLQANDRAHAVIIAIRRGLVTI